MATKKWLSENAARVSAARKKLCSNCHRKLHAKKLWFYGEMDITTRS